MTNLWIIYSAIAIHVGSYALHLLLTALGRNNSGTGVLLLGLLPVLSVVLFLGGPGTHGWFTYWQTGYDFGWWTRWQSWLLFFGPFVGTLLQLAALLGLAVGASLRSDRTVSAFVAVSYLGLMLNALVAFAFGTD